jgi:WD40 repeat protein
MALHGPVRAPQSAGVGRATLTATLVGWKAGQVSPTKFTAEVVLPKVVVKTEPVSSRLLRSLPHPDRQVSLPIVAFTPAGRLIVSGYPSGVVQVFDPTAGKEVHTIETPRGYRGSFGYLKVSDDFRTLFVAMDNSKFEPIRVGDRKTYYRRYSGETRVYDLGTGAQKESLRVEPRRGVMLLAVSPDGRRVATMEYSSGLSEDFNKLRAIYLWDVTTRKAVKLRDGYGDLRFSPDGKTVLVIVNDHARKSGVVYAYSVDTAREVGKVESKEGVWPGFAFSRDGKQVAAATIDAKTKKPVVRLYDPHSLEARASLPAGDAGSEGPFVHLTFSPDGRRLAAVAKTTVYLWDVEGRKVLKTWRLETPGRVWSLSFDPAGGRLAASTWFVPPELKNTRDEALTPEDFPQPKVFLIDVRADKAETIVCPHGWWGRAAFSPDGNLLAVGGAGTTHLFDVRKK